jgi:DHA1 family bicyclomycin/chloramphenicol resistance-like MFS transporter
MRRISINFTNFYLVLILGALNTLSAVSIDMYLPAFAHIARDLSSSVEMVSLSVSSYFCGMSVGQPIYGPLLDRFGRKKPLYAGMSIYLFASICCFFAASVADLILIRFLQGFGGCAASIAATAMVRDLFSVSESSKVFSRFELILGVSPLMAPGAGSLITHYLGWRMIFVLLAVIAIVLLGVSRLVLPDVAQPDTSVSLNPKAVTSTFMQVVKVPHFYTYALSGSFSFSGLFVYVSGASIIFMDTFRMSSSTFSLLFALMSLSFVGGSQINIYLQRRHSSERIFKIAVITQAILGILSLSMAYSGLVGPFCTVVGLFLYLSCIGLTLPNSSALSLAPFSRNAGAAAAALRFLQIGVGGITSSSIGLFTHTSCLSIFMMMTVSAVLAVLSLLWGERTPTPKNLDLPTSEH